MKYLNSTLSDSSAKIQMEFTREQTDFIPKSVSYSVGRTMVDTYECVKVTSDIEVEPATFVDIVLTPEQLHWDERYTDDILVLVKYTDEDDHPYVEGISFKITRQPCLK